MKPWGQHTARSGGLTYLDVTVLLVGSLHSSFFNACRGAVSAAGSGTGQRPRMGRVCKRKGEGRCCGGEDFPGRVERRSSKGSPAIAVRSGGSCAFSLLIPRFHENSSASQACRTRVRFQMPDWGTTRLGAPLRCLVPLGSGTLNTGSLGNAHPT